MPKTKQEVRALNAAELVHYVLELRQELFALRLNASTSHVKDYSQFKKIRRAIASALTYSTQMKHASAKANL